MNKTSSDYHTTQRKSNTNLSTIRLCSGHGCRLVLPPQLSGGELASTHGDAREIAGGAVDCMRPHLPDMIELLHDPHLLNKIKVKSCII